MSRRNNIARQCQGSDLASCSQSDTTPPFTPLVIRASATPSSTGIIAGSVIGGVLFLALLVLGIFLYLRARKRRRTPPSSEFINSIRDGAPPVLRGVENGTRHARHSPPFMPYQTSPPMKYPDKMMMTDIPSERLSVEKPLHPQRYSSQRDSDSFHLASTSIGSRRELWGSDTEIIGGLSPFSQSPRQTSSALQFASMDSSSSHMHSLPSLHPLRRPPDPEGTT